MAPWPPLVQLVVVLASVVALWVGARLFVDAAVRLARGAGLSELAIGLTIVAVGTSTPEVAVSVDAAFRGLGDIAVGNVLGSNVYNLAAILGGVALLRPIPVPESLVRRDGTALLASTAVGGFALVDLGVSRVEGVALVGLFAAYTAYSLAAGRTGGGNDSEAAPGPVSAVAREATGRPSFRGRDPLFLVVGLVVILVSGDALVGAAVALARAGGVSELVIGGTVVAAGTSTPEFAVSLVALRRGSVGVSAGNVVGSNIFNLVGITGAAAVVRPLSVSGAALETLAWLAAVTLAAVAALWTRRTLSRVEGALLVSSEVLRWTLNLLGRIG